MSDNEDTQRQDGCEEATFEEKLEETQRLTTQWSVEDEEEAARERRRREREREQQLGSEGQSPEDANGETCTPSDEHMALKPSGAWETEEDEGFSDWSQKLEQMKLKGAAQATEEREELRQMEEQCEAVGTTEEETGDQQPKAEEEEDEGTSRYEAPEVNYEVETCNYEHSSHETVTSHQWETRESNDNEEENRTSSPYPREEAETLEQEREGRENDFESYNYQRESHSERWEPEEVKRQSVSSEGEDNDAITVKVTERAEVLNRSIQKSNSIKRSEPPLPINKIDDRLEQYTHAIETSKTGRLARTPSLELLSPADAVASMKNMWEAGEVTSASKSSPCKDTDGINIGVSDMINQWGKGKSEPDGQAGSSKVPEVKPGDVLSKKSLWEQNAKSVQSNKNVTPKYKFVPTGHGKYEKVRMEEP